MEKKLAFIGGGAMCEAILAGRKGSGLDLSSVSVYDPAPSSRLDELSQKLGIKQAASFEEAVQGKDMVILAVKPQVLPQILADVAKGTTSETIIVSIAARINLPVLEKGMPERRVVRVIPNTPFMIGEGMSGICQGTLASQADVEALQMIFSASGKILIIKEAQMDALSEISGCDPTFVYLFVEVLMDDGVLSGLPRKDALLLADQTVQGAARMVFETANELAALKRQVTSPGGTTIAGVHVLENRVIRGAVMDAVTATIKRSEELGNG